MTRRLRLDNKGFTLVEMLVVITIIGILAAIALPNFMKAKNKAKEAECRANLHIIQTALERYSVDHDGNYPPYLIGGDKSGWMRWHRQYDDPDNPNDFAVFLHDPLVEYGYMDSYPSNPFIEDGSIMVAFTGGDSEIPGSGDPRFGFGGAKIGNVVTDPRYYRKDNMADIRDPVIETARTLPSGANFSDPYHYEMGGHLDSNGNKIRLTWHGQFFYRATRDIKIGRTGGLDGIEKYPDYGWTDQNPYYILGTFGAEETRGLDVIRLINIDSQGAQLNYRTPPASGMTIPVGRAGVDGNGIPEVFGHGDRDRGPVWPYNFDVDMNGSQEFRFGAPDGVEDGVLMILTSAGNHQNF